MAERRYDVKPPIFSSGVVRIRESLHRERFQGVDGDGRCETIQHVKEVLSGLGGQYGLPAPAVFEGLALWCMMLESGGG